MKVLKWIAIAGVVALVIYTAKKMKFPLLNIKVTSPFGTRIHPVKKIKSFHNGVDFKGKVGDAIYSPFDGIVKGTNIHPTGGLQLFILHSNGYTTGYAHLNKVFVKKGQAVKQGEQIAEVGASGRVTGPHLHFTVTDATGNKIDPMKVLA